MKYIGISIFVFIWCSLAHMGHQVAIAQGLLP